MSSFATYLIGFIILIGGLAFGATLLNVPGMWIGVGVVVLIGVAVLMATTRTKMRDTGGGGGSPPSSRGPTAPTG